MYQITTYVSGRRIVVALYNNTKELARDFRAKYVNGVQVEGEMRPCLVEPVAAA